MDTKVKPVEVLPLVKYYMEQLGLARLFDKFVGAEFGPVVRCRSGKPPDGAEERSKNNLRKFVI